MRGLSKSGSPSERKAANRPYADVASLTVGQAPMHPLALGLSGASRAQFLKLRGPRAFRTAGLSRGPGRYQPLSITL
jgi:hypothetical protein